jgi:hypothetical protein
MNPFDIWSKASVVVTIILFTALDGSVARPWPAESARSASCMAPEYRQFDFWAGDWDAFETDSQTKVAGTRVDVLLNGCVLRENYEGTDGHSGQSFTIYDASRQVWHQTWVTNRGQLLVVEGKIQNGEVVLSGVDRLAGGKKRNVRGVWKPVNAGVRETAQTSTDGGKTWKLWFDLVFRPHKE